MSIEASKKEIINYESKRPAAIDCKEFSPHGAAVSQFPQKNIAKINKILRYRETAFLRRRVVTVREKSRSRTETASYSAALSVAGVHACR